MRVFRKRILCGTAGGGYSRRFRKAHQMCQSGCPNAPANWPHILPVEAGIDGHDDRF